MKKTIIHEESNLRNVPRHALDEICRQGAQKMLIQALYLQEQQEKYKGQSLG